MLFCETIKIIHVNDMAVYYGIPWMWYYGYFVVSEKRRKEDGVI